MSDNNDILDASDLNAIKKVVSEAFQGVSEELSECIASVDATMQPVYPKGKMNVPSQFKEGALKLPDGKGHTVSVHPLEFD